MKNIIKRILKRRHFWRDAGFDELTELYISSMLRTFAVSVLMVFIPFYLYQEGYAVYQIFSFYGWYFIGKAAADVGASYFIARFGPKHSMIISCVLQIIAAAMMLTLPEAHWPLWLPGPLLGAAASFFFIAYHVEFSKIKHSDHAGKEIGNMQIFERTAAVVGPLAGGAAGSFLGAQYIFIIASLVLVASLWPLFRTAEQISTHQKLRFNDIPLRSTWRDYVSYAGLGAENTLCINLWPLYVALFALGGAVYAKLGAITSLSVFASVLAAHLIGKLVDARDARSLLRVAAVSNSFVYICRPFVHSLGLAFLTNVANEIITTGYRLPYLKGMYAQADALPGLRIVYIGSMEFIGSVTKAATWLLMAIMATALDVRTVLIVGFGLAGLLSFVIMTERFAALKPR